jgi:hypothetical protein
MQDKGSQSAQLQERLLFAVYPAMVFLPISMKETLFIPFRTSSPEVQK